MTDTSLFMISDTMEATTRVRRKDTRADEIIDSAITLFLDKGFENVTFSDIAKHGKMARSTIYLYFKDKNELLRASVHKKFQDHVQIFTASKIKSDDPSAKVMDKLLSVMHKMFQTDEYPKFMTLVASLATRDPVIAEIWKEESLNHVRDIWNELAVQLHLSEELSSLYLTTLFSIFFTACLTKTCFKDESPFLSFSDFTKIAKNQKGGIYAVLGMNSSTNEE